MHVASLQSTIRLSESEQAALRQQMQRVKEDAEFQLADVRFAILGINWLFTHEYSAIL
jgi:hypothetical protein